MHRYIRVRLCRWSNGHVEELELYDDVPVYASGRVHFGLTRQLWHLPNLAVCLRCENQFKVLLINGSCHCQIVDVEHSMFYGIQEPYSVAHTELRPFLRRDCTLRVIGQLSSLCINPCDL